MAKYVKSLLIFILLVLWKTISGKLVDYPKYPRYLHQDYRSIVITWDRVKDFNLTGQADGELYEIKYRLYLPPPYFPQRMITNFTHGKPVVTLRNLLVNTMLVVRVGLKYNSQREPDTYSPYLMFHTTQTPKNKNIELPSHVTDITLQESIIRGNESRIHLAWKTPSDVLKSSKHLFRSIQYAVRVCNYNPLTNEKTNCTAVADVVQDYSKQRQSTFFEGLYESNEIWVKRNRDVAFLVTSVTLNGQEGSTACKVVRLDANSAPQPPFNVTVLYTTNSSLTIKWSSILNATSYRIEYKILERSGIAFELIDGVRQVSLGGLQQGTDYEIKIAINESVNGSSVYSAPIIVRTKGKPPLKLPNGAQSSLNRSRLWHLLVLTSFTAHMLVFNQ